MVTCDDNKLYNMAGWIIFIFILKSRGVVGLGVRIPISFIFLVNGDGSEDKCARGNGGCNHICVNQGGKAQCLCKNGFKLRTDGRTCIGESLQSKRESLAYQ